MNLSPPGYLGYIQLTKNLSTFSSLFKLGVFLFSHISYTKDGRLERFFKQGLTSLATIEKAMRLKSEMKPLIALAGLSSLNKVRDIVVI